MGKCCAENCMNRTGSHNKIRFHRFPKDPEIFAKWVQAIRIRKNIKPNKHSILCSEHFVEDDYAGSKIAPQKFLKKTAVPSIVKFPDKLNQKTAVISISKFSDKYQRKTVVLSISKCPDKYQRKKLCPKPRVQNAEIVESALTVTVTPVTVISPVLRKKETGESKPLVQNTETVKTAVLIPILMKKEPVQPNPAQTSMSGENVSRQQNASKKAERTKKIVLQRVNRNNEKIKSLKDFLKTPQFTLNTGKRPKWDLKGSL